MPLSFVGVELLVMPAFSSSGVMVEVEVDREKVLARGARCVSLSSDSWHVSTVLGIWKVNGKVQRPQSAGTAAVSTLLSTGEAERHPERIGR
jgi:hypothetical protein